MHYMNGRGVTIGDWVVGVSHNSNHKPICGLVVAMMPEQGPCNIRVHIWEDEYFTEEGHPRDIPAVESRGKDHYGDAKEFILAADGLRMIKAVMGHGNWDGPYMT